jgi:hypothetical protein
MAHSEPRLSRNSGTPGTRREPVAAGLPRVSDLTEGRDDPVPLSRSGNVTEELRPWRAAFGIWSLPPGLIGIVYLREILVAAGAA